MSQCYTRLCGEIRDKDGGGITVVVRVQEGGFEQTTARLKAGDCCGIKLTEAPCTLHPHPTPCTLHPAPCTLHPAPCTLHPAPCTLHSASCTLHPTPCTLHPAPFTLHPTPYTLHPTSSFSSSYFLFSPRSRRPLAYQSRNPESSTLNPQPSTLNPQPSTLNPQPSNLKRALRWFSYPQILDPEPQNSKLQTLNPEP